MAKTTPQTVETTRSVPAFIKNIEDKQRQKDCFDIIGIMKEASGFEPKMWGPAIIGFGSYHYKYESGHEGDAPLVAFASRKSAIVLYIPDFEGKQALMEKIGKHKSTKGCVYIKKLEDVNPLVLKKLATACAKYYSQKYK